LLILGWLLADATPMLQSRIKIPADITPPTSAHQHSGIIFFTTTALLLLVQRGQTRASALEKSIEGNSKKYDASLECKYEFLLLHYWLHIY